MLRKVFECEVCGELKQTIVKISLKAIKLIIVNGDKNSIETLPRSFEFQGCSTKCVILSLTERLEKLFEEFDGPKKEGTDETAKNNS